MIGHADDDEALAMKSTRRELFEVLTEISELAPDFRCGQLVMPGTEIPADILGPLKKRIGYLPTVRDKLP